MSAAATARAPALPGSLRLELPAYGLALIGAEACFAFGHALLGLLAHAILLFVLLTRRALAPADAGAAADALVALALVPVLRLVSATIVVPELSTAARYAAVGGPVLLSAVTAARTRLAPRFALAPRSWPRELAIAATGVPLGYAAFLVAGRPEPLLQDRPLAQVVAAALVLFLLVGCVEELVFRGTIQDALGAVYGRAGVLASCGLGGAVYLAVRPGAYAVLAVGVGVGFAVLAERTRSVAGVAAAHGLLAAGAFLVWPLVLG